MPGEIAGGPWALGELAPILVLAVAFCEALVVIGLFVPLTPLLVALGVAMAAGTLHPTILAWAIGGNKGLTDALPRHDPALLHRRTRRGIPGRPLSQWLGARG